MSEAEVVLDLQQQRLEKAVAKELENTPNIISKTGIFDNIDKLYGNPSGSTANAATTTDSENTGAVPSFGGGSFETAPPPAGKSESSPRRRQRPCRGRSQR